MTVKEQLAGYIALQRLLDRKASLQRERDVPPEELVALRARFAERDSALSSQRTRQESLAKEQASLQQELEALREEREHFRKQKSQVTNMKQLTAVVSELDHVETQLKSKEERLLAVMGELEAIEQQAAALTAEGPEDRAAREQGEAAWEARRKTVEVELTVVKRELASCQQRLGSAAMERFKKLWNTRKPNAVVPLEGSSCSMCHADLRPSLVQEIRALEDLRTCDHCRRLLFDPEQFPL